MRSAHFISFSLFFQVSGALYRQWIPDTNFNNATNWDKGRIPCKNDRVQFPRDKSLSVFMQSSLHLMEMSSLIVTHVQDKSLDGKCNRSAETKVPSSKSLYLHCNNSTQHANSQQSTSGGIKYKYLPLDGEYILSHGAGFAASDGQSESGCETGEDITFKDSDQYQWYDPKHWRTALSVSDLENEKYLFTLDEESVPCQYDDVIFRPGTSFCVNLDSDTQMINVKTISVMNRKFTSNEEFTEYKWSSTGKLQFQGNGSIAVTNTKCDDKSGCECGNFGNHRRICSNLHQRSGRLCPGLLCTNSLRPQGHCCKICGAIIYLEYGPAFDLESYRVQLIDSFLGLKKYKGVQMSVTKVSNKQSSKKIIPIDVVPHIQIVLIDKVELAPGTLAAALAQEIMEDTTSQGHKFGITNAWLEKSEEQDGAYMNAGSVVGIVAGVLIAVLLIGKLTYLIVSGKIRANIPSAVINFRRYMQFDNEETTERGISNPVFGSSVHLSPDSNGLYFGENSINTVADQSGTNFVNPSFEQDFNDRHC